MVKCQLDMFIVKINIIDICKHFTIISTQMSEKQHLLINVNKMRHHYVQHQLSDNIIAIKDF